MKRGALVASHKASQVIESHAELSALNRRLFDQFPVLKTVALRPIGGMKPIVEAVPQAVGRVLRVAGATVSADL